MILLRVIVFCLLSQATLFSLCLAQALQGESLSTDSCSLLPYEPQELQSKSLSKASGKSDFHIRPQQVIVPAAMITAGAIAVSNQRLCTLKYDLRDDFQRWRGQHHKADVETYITLSTQLIVLAVGPKPKHKFVDRMLVKATSYALLYATMPVVRRCVSEPRPDGHSDHAFPSFKTANAFMAAEQIRIERGWGWGMGAYTIAAGVGALQLYNDRAYVNDVVAGAGMGILATHAAYWLLPLERRWFGLDKRKRKDAAIMVVPTYDVTTQTAGITLAAQL